MLSKKNAVIYGASPSLGGAVAREMARAGARVFVTNHRMEVAEKVADQIRSEGGLAEAAQVDATDEISIQTHLDGVIKKAGTIDISFNLIGIKVIQNIPLIEMKVDDFVHPVSDAMHTHFLTATAAGRLMSKQGSGVILSLTATPGGIGYPGVGGFGPLCCAMEAFSRNLACELGPSGVRVVNIRSGGSLDSRPFKEASASGVAGVEDVFKKMKADTMLKEMPSMSDIASTAVFLASEMARRITGVTIDVTVGTTAGLNHRTNGNAHQPNIRPNPVR
jgi:NAD(P)-dependent dehydrogenase (short-subunit alcohol dehydrogenase family)